MFHTITSRSHSQAAAADVVLSVEEHDDVRWVPLGDALELPLVWHVGRTVRALLG